MPDDDPLLDPLRAEDPVDVGGLPAHDDAAPAALLREITMATPESPRRSAPRPWLLAAAAAIVAVLAIGGAVALTSGDDDDSDIAAPTTTAPAPDDPVIGGGSAQCVELYDLQTLQNRELAFAGTVLEASGDQVTFAVERWFRGGEGNEVTLTSSTGGAITPDAGPPLEPGARLLVAGDGGFAWGCGFTQTYDPAVAEEWAEALAS